jgi:hypothetical protein
VDSPGFQTLLRGTLQLVLAYIASFCFFSCFFFVNVASVRLILSCSILDFFSKKPFTWSPIPAALVSTGSQAMLFLPIVFAVESNPWNWLKLKNNGMLMMQIFS